jgi:putative FmdB family regulatory protein
MPLYIYGCPECEIEIEELRPAERADDNVECPICHGLCLRELSRFSAHVNSPSPPIYAAPQQVARAVHLPDCACCTPRRR